MGCGRGGRRHRLRTRPVHRPSRRGATTRPRRKERPGMTRRTTGGSIRRLASRDLWQARYVGADGKRHAQYAKSRREAQARLRTALCDADHGIRPTGQQLTLSAFLADWLVASKLRVRSRTHESYAAAVRLYIEPSIGR